MFYGVLNTSDYDYDRPLSVCCAAAEATLRPAKLCIERNDGHLKHVLGIVVDDLI